MKSRYTNKSAVVRAIPSQKRSGESGVYLMVFIGVLLAIFFVAGLAIDSAHLYHRKLQIQRAVDAATIRATMSLRSTATPEEIEQIANDVVADNLEQYNLLDHDRVGDLADLPIEVIVDPIGASPRTVTVRANSDVPFLLFNSAASPRWGTKRLDALARGSAEKLCIGLVLDATLSLDIIPAGHSISKLDALKMAAVGFVNQFVEGYDLFSLTTFNATATLRFPIAPLDKTALNSFISVLPIDAWTNLYDGIRVGKESLRDNPACDGVRKILVLFTDGAPTDPRPAPMPPHPALGATCSIPDTGDPDYSIDPPELYRRKVAQVLPIIEANNARSEGIEVYTIGLGSENPVGRNRAYGDLTTVGSLDPALVDWDDELKSDLLRKIANDSSLEVRPTGMDFDCVQNREEYNAGDEPPHSGLYLGTPNPGELSSLFNQLALLLNGRIVELR